MLGLMQDVPLLISSLIVHADRHLGNVLARVGRCRHQLGGTGDRRQQLDGFQRNRWRSRCRLGHEAAIVGCMQEGCDGVAHVRIGDAGADLSLQCRYVVHIGAAHHTQAIVVVPEFSRERQQWYCDVELTAAAYFPFLSLALARYQDDSVHFRGLSSVVRATRSPMRPAWLSLFCQHACSRVGLGCRGMRLVPWRRAPGDCGIFRAAGRQGHRTLLTGL